VIVGVGSSKYRTEIVEDLFDNPVFNTECDMYDKLSVRIIIVIVMLIIIVTLIK